MARILIVDDEPTIGMLLQMVMQDEGHDAIWVCDGEEALEALKKDLRPDLALVDLFMPRMDGKSLITRMAQHPNWNQIPVLIISGATLSEGAFPPRTYFQGLIVKPFDVDEVVTVVHELLNRGFPPR